MAAYSFLKEAKLYLVKNNTKYQIPISAVTFNQTFTESSTPVKNLHNSDIFEGSVINKANPANFTFKCLVLKENRLSTLFNCILDLSYCDLYIETKQDVFKLENAVFTSTSFPITKGAAFSLDVSGEAAKLRRLGDFGNAIIPGTEHITDSTILIAKDNEIVLGGDNIANHAIQATIEIQNNITWIPYVTINGAINTSTMYPSAFYLEDRIVAGSVSRYVTPETDEDLQTYSSSTTLRIKVGQEIGGTFYGFDFNIGSCSYTNRLNTGAIFTQNYDWRMTDNSTSLDNIITYITT